MALSNKEGKRTYVQIKNGQFAVLCNSNPIPEGAVEVISVKSGKKNYFMLYNELSGTITGFSTETREVSGAPLSELKVHITDGDENYVLSLNQDNDYFTSFVKFILNADITKPVKLSASEKKEGEKIYKNIFVSQNGTTMKAAWNKDSDPKDQPPKWESTKFKDKTLWDKSEQIAWLLNKVNGLAANLVSPVEAAVVNKPSDFPDDDLPF